MVSGNFPGGNNILVKQGIKGYLCCNWKSTYRHGSGNKDVILKNAAAFGSVSCSVTVDHVTERERERERVCVSVSVRARARACVCVLKKKDAINFSNRDNSEILI